MSKILLAAAIAAATITTGCATRIADLSVASSKSMDVTKNYRIDRMNKIKGADSKPIVFLFPTGNPSIEDAMDDAIESAPGSIGIADAKLVDHSWMVPLCCGSLRITVEGYPIYEVTEDKDE